MRTVIFNNIVSLPGFHADSTGTAFVDGHGVDVVDEPVATCP